jgi:type IV secretion system protein VirB3
MMWRRPVTIDLSWIAKSFVRKLAAQANRNAQRVSAPGDGETETSTLFIADTRPALAYGIPHILACALMILFGESIVIVGPIYCFWVVIPYLAARILVRKDYNGPRIFAMWIASKAFDLRTAYWHGASPSPLPLNETKYPRGIWP